MNYKKTCISAHTPTKTHFLQQIQPKLSKLAKNVYLKDIEIEESESSSKEDLSNNFESNYAYNPQDFTSFKISFKSTSDRDYFYKILISRSNKYKFRSFNERKFYHFLLKNCIFGKNENILKGEELVLRNVDKDFGLEDFLVVLGQSTSNGSNEVKSLERIYTVGYNSSCLLSFENEKEKNEIFQKIRKNDNFSKNCEIFKNQKIYAYNLGDDNDINKQLFAIIEGGNKNKKIDEILEKITWPSP